MKRFKPEHFASEEDLQKHLNWIDEICEDCGLRCVSCYRCDIYYDRVKVVKRLEKYKFREVPFNEQRE